MYGLVNKALRDLVLMQFGKDRWKGLGKRFNVELDVSVDKGHDNGHDHDEFLIRFQNA